MNSDSKLTVIENWILSCNKVAYRYRKIEGIEIYYSTIKFNESKASKFVKEIKNTSKTWIILLRI